MAENWKNNILPKASDLDLGSLAYTDNDSLTDIAGKYTNLGSQVNNLANAAAQDVHTRQVKLIGNDFGAVDPMMYAAYYQPSANDIQSEMRMKGTQKALSEGMVRGKAAAEAELEAAKNRYSNALDSYKNAKDAFANLKVVTANPSVLPEGVTESNFGSFDSFSGDKETARRNIKAYTDAQGVDWSKEDIWSHAASKTIESTGTDTTGWGENEWKNYWARNDVSRIFENNYISEYIGTVYGEDKQRAYEASYNEILNTIDQVFDYINNISDNLPDLDKTEIFYLQDNPSVGLSEGTTRDKMMAVIFGPGDETTKYNTSLNEYTYWDWIDENIAEEYREDVKKMAAEVSGKNNQMGAVQGTLPWIKKARELMRADKNLKYDDAVAKAKFELGKKYYDYIQDKIDVGKQGNDGQVTVTEIPTSEMVDNIFGFSLTDMKALATWRKTNPDEYNSYKEQLAQINGLADTMEVADGKRYYWTGSKYEQLAAGTPVFFAYQGALNEDGSIRDPELKKFVDLWKDFYSADVDAISDEELTDKKTALNDAYKKYMEHVSTAPLVNSIFQVQITGDIYNSILASFESNISSSDAEIGGVKVKDIIKEFNDMDQAHKYTAFTDLVKAAYSNTDKFYRYTDLAKGIVSEKVDYDDDSQASGYSRLDATNTAFGVADSSPSKYANMTAVEAVPYFLAITRSMEQHNKGTTTGNIDPGFLDTNFFQYTGRDLGQQVMGTVDFWAAALNFITGCIAAPVNLMMGNNANPADNELFGKGLSANNVIGAAVRGTREYNMDDDRQRSEYLLELDKRNREYAASVINPLLIDVYFGDQDMSTVRGLGDEFTSEGGGMFRNWNSAWKTGVTFADMFAVNWLEGKVIGGIAKGTAMGISAAANSKMAAKIELLTWPRKIKNLSDVEVMGRKIEALSTKIAEISAIIDNIDDPHQLYNALKTAVGELDDLGIDTSNIAKLLDKSDDIGSLKKAAEEIVSMKNAGLLEDAKNTLQAIKEGKFSSLSPERAAALSSLTTDDLGTLLTEFSDFVQYAKRNPSTKAFQQSISGLGKITLASGQVVDAFDAGTVVMANRVAGVVALANATGLSALDLARLPDAARKTLLKTLNGMTSDYGGLITNRTLTAFLKSMGENDFKNLAAEFISRAAVNAQIGKKWDIFDTYRAAAAAGWERSGVTALAREFMTDALTDPLRDFKRNVSIPQVDQEGNARVQTVQEYFTDPVNLMTNLVISSAHFGVSRIYNQVAGTTSGWAAKKAWDAYNATGDKTSEEAARLYKKAVKLNAKAQKYADNAWKRGLSFEKATANAELSNKIVDDAVQKIFAASSWDIDYSGKSKHFSSKEEYIKFIIDTLAPTKDSLFVLANSTNIKAINNFFMFKAQIGTGLNEVGNIPKSSQLKLLTTFRDTYNSNIQRIKGGDGDFWSKNHEMYILMKNAALDANKAGEYGVTIRNLERSLDGFFSNLETMAKNGVADGTLDNLRIGYIPVSSLYFDGSFDDMIQSHRMAATRGLLHEGGSVDVAAANPAEPRDLFSFDSLITKMNKGDETFDVIGEDGKVLRTVQLDYDGTNLLDMMVTYSNNYNLHKYIDPLMGDSRTDFGVAYLANNHAFLLGDWNMIQKAWNTDFKQALNKLTGWDEVDKKTGEKIHHTGWNEIILGRAEADPKSKLTKEQLAELRTKHSTEVNVKDADREQLTQLRKEYTVAKKKLENAKAIMDNGDAPDSLYPIVSTVFNLDVDGTPNVKQAKEIVDNGRIIAKNLVKAYSNGDITDANLKTGYTMKTKNGYRDIEIDDTMLQKLEYASKNNGQIDSDLIFYAAVNYENAFPYTKKTVDRGVTTYDYVKGYKNRLQPNYFGTTEDALARSTNNAKKPQGQTYEVSTAGDKRFSALNAKFTKGTEILGVDVSGKTIEDVYQNIAKASGKGKAPAKDSPIAKYIAEKEAKAGRKLTEAEKVAVSQKFMDRLWDVWGGQNPKLKAEIENLPAGTKLTDKFSKKGTVSQATSLQRWIKEGDLLSNENVDVTIKDANKAKAVEVFGNDKGEVTFGGKETTDARTGKVTVAGGKTVDAAKFYSTELKFGRNESGDIIEKSLESSVKTADEVAAASLYASMDTKISKGEYDPTAFQKRYVESVIGRTKTELADSKLAVDGSEWIQRIDKNAAEPKLVKAYGIDDDVTYTGLKDGKEVTKKTTLARQVKTLEQDGALGAFKDNLQAKAVRVLAGDFDDYLPAGYSKEQLADVITRAWEFMDSVEVYGTHAKSSDTLSSMLDSEGNEIGYDEAYSDFASSNIKGKSDQIYDLSGRNIDLSTDNVESHLKAFKAAVRAYSDKSNPMHDIFTSDELENLKQRKIDFNNQSKDLANKINDEAKALYDSKKNPEFNKRVDQVYQDIVARTSKHGLDETEIKYQYLEALGIAAPGSGLSSTGTGAYGQTTNRYFAAKLAEDTGVEDLAEAGWSQEVTKMRLQAGNNKGYAEQLSQGIERLKKYAGETDSVTKLSSDVNSFNSTISSLVDAKPFNADDNFEDSAMALFSDVYDRRAMSPVANKAEFEQNIRNTKWRFDNIVSEMLTGEKAHTEGMTVQKVNDSATAAMPPADKMAADLRAFYDADNTLREAEYFAQYGKHDKEAVDPGISVADATKARSEAFDNLYNQYGKTITPERFEDRLLNGKRQAEQLANDYNSMVAEYSQMQGSDSLAPSAVQGKTSIFTPAQLSYATSKASKHWIADEKVFTANIGGEETTLRPELDFGTAQELSDTAVGMRVMNKLNDEVDLKSLTPEEAEAVMPMLRESLEGSGLDVKPSNGLASDTDILQDLGNGYVLVGIPKTDEPLKEMNFGRGRFEDDPNALKERALARYTEYTKDYNPAKQLKTAQKEFDAASKKLEALKKKGTKVSEKVKKGYLRTDDLAAKYLTEEELPRYKRDYEAYQAIKEAKPTEEADFYHANFVNGKNGKYMILGNNSNLPKGYTTLYDLLALVGYDEKNFNHDITESRVYTDEEIAKDKTVRKAMMKEVNKNLRSGNAKFRNVQDYKNPSVLDIKSQTATINNLLAFAAQVDGVTAHKKGEVIDPKKIAIDKDSADLLFRISREGIQPNDVKSSLKSIAFEISDWNKFIQDFQLAGGASYINAMSIAQMRGAILSNPTKMAQYLKLVVDFKDDAAIANFVIKNGKRLSEIAMKVGDATILTDFQAACSDIPGLEDGGTLSAATYRMIKNYENSKKGNRSGTGEKYEFAKSAVQDNVDALFTDATFNRMLPVLRAKMLMQNYDNAVRSIRHHFRNVDEDTLADSAAKYAYARTVAFFEPNKTAGGIFKSKSITETLDNIYDDNLRRFLSSWTGAKDEISIGQMTSNCFFALGYKQRMIQPLAQGAKSMFGLGNIMDRLSLLKPQDVATSDQLAKLGTQFMQSGNRQQLRSLATIAIGAFVTAKALGLATSWDDLSFVDEADGEFKVPDILKKFQTIGQIWIPNAGELDFSKGIDWGKSIFGLYVDPTKPAYNIDTMSSIFTLPNSGWKTIDRIANPNAYYSAPQRGIGLLGQMTGINPQGINDFLNNPFLRGIFDEAIGANLLSPYKAMYEVLVDSSYYGNNIWEKRYLSDGSENPNYDPVRNIKASFFHILGLDNYRTLSPRKYNDYVKGYYTDDYVAQDQIGSIGGAGLFQHEYVTAIINILEGDALEGVIEAGELPIKKQTFSSSARTDFNTRIKNIIADAMAEYRNKTDGETNADVKDAAYADAVKKCADAVATWSAKYDFVLGRDQSLVPYVTRSMMAVLAGEYDDRLDYIQNTYWKASQIAQIEATGPAGYWLDDNDIDAWLESGKTAEEFAAEKNKRHEAYNKALDEEYKARKALHDAGIDNEYLAGMSYQNLKAEQRAVNKSAYTEAMGIVNSRIGEFDNFKEMKQYYEAQIDAATTKNAKAKLANQYNTYLTDALAPVVQKYGAGIISDGYYNNNYLSNHLADYVIIPADKYYTGKSPRSSYLKDLFGVGYKNTKNEPSDDEVIEAYTQARKQMTAGNSASAVAALDRTIDAIKKGQLHVTDADYSKIIRMRALLSARSK